MSTNLFCTYKIECDGEGRCTLYTWNMRGTFWVKTGAFRNITEAEIALRRITELKEPPVYTMYYDAKGEEVL